MAARRFQVSGSVRRFAGKNGWHYVALDPALSEELRPRLMKLWPALLRASFRIRKTSWESSIMPIKEGPLFIALPARVRAAERIAEGEVVAVTFVLTDR
jgi:hypothetical protein